MHISKPDDVLLLQGFEKRGSQCYLIATVGYVLEPDGRLMPEETAWQWLAPQFMHEPFDLGLQKRRGTFGVAGAAHAPGGQPVARMAIRVRFGGCEKTLHVYGDRQWRHGLTGWRPSDPLPFLHMPVDLAHAFGGPDHASNPYGKGAISAGADPAGTPLPNIEWPNEPVRSIQDFPRVAALGNLPATTPCLARWAGTFNAAWEASRFPWLPDDVDPRYFDRVAQDQCADAYWRGDERWSVEGMHPERPLVEGILPGLRPKLLWLRDVSSPWLPVAAPQIQRAELTLDTVWLFPETGRQVLLYRAALPVEREDGADVAAIWIDTLPAGVAVPDLPAQLALWAQQSPHIAPRLAAASGAVAMASVPTEANATSSPAAALRDSGGQLKASERQPQADRSEVSTAGAVSIDLEGSPSAMTDADLSAGMVEAARTAASLASSSWSDALWDEVCKEYSQAWDQARQAVSEMQEEQAEYGIIFPQVAPFGAPPKPGVTHPPGALPVDFAQSLLREMEQALEEGRRTFEAVLHESLPDDPQMVESIRAKARAAAQAPPLTDAQGEAILSNLPAELRARADAEVRALSAQFEHLHRQLAQVFEKAPPAGSSAAVTATQGSTGTDGAGSSDAASPGPLTSASSAVRGTEAEAFGRTAGLDPLEPRARISLAGLETVPNTVDQASFSSATATTGQVGGNTMLRDAVLENRNYDGADLIGADFRGAVLTDCSFVGAKLAGASFEGARVESCDFTEADLSDARLSGMDARDTLFTRAKLTGIQAQRISLVDCNLSEIEAAGADLSEAQVDRCTLDKACLTHATLVAATFSSVQGCSADFSDSRAQGWRIESDTRLENTSFQRAAMQHCSFMHSRFVGSDWREADVCDGMILACDLSGTRAQRMRAQRAVFKDSRIQDADWRQSDMMEATFDYAVLQRVDMSGCNLHAVQTRTADIRSLQVQDALLGTSRLLQEHGHA